MREYIKMIRGANKKDIFDRKFNIFIGISLGNKWFTKEHLRVYLRWALENTKQKVAFLIADKLHAINWEVRSGYNPDRALRKALREGDKVETIVKELIVELPEEKQKIIDVVRWNDIERNRIHKKMIKVFWEMFENNKTFRKEVLHLVRNAIDNREAKFIEDEIVLLSKYFIEELPTMLNGFEHNGVYYSLYPYPFKISFGKFVQDLQEKKIFHELHDKLKIGKNVLVVLEAK